MAARILIIEDNQTNMELMVCLLAAFGYTPETARDGKEGFDKAEREPPDLIICDLEMPEMNGYKVAQQLKSRAELQRIPLIAVTAYAMVGDRNRVLTAGFDGYLPKPLDPESFVQQVETFLPPEKRFGRAPAVRDMAGTPAQPRQPKRATILVVDDSPINLSLIRSTVEPSGYQVIGAETVDQAIEQAGKNSFDVIVSDLHMSPESGLGFLRRVKADPKLRRIPFVLFTASRSNEEDRVRRRALELGADMFLTRPIEPNLLLSLIDTLL
jgi:two-component system cell cycle response regulator